MASHFRFGRLSLFIHQVGTQCGISGQGLGGSLHPPLFHSLHCPKFRMQRSAFPKARGAASTSVSARAWQPQVRQPSQGWSSFFPPDSYLVSQSYKRENLGEVRGGLEACCKGASPRLMGRKGTGSLSRGTVRIRMSVPDGKDLQSARALHTFATSPHPPARLRLQATGSSARG